jgi:hypothetical protein
MFTVRRFVHQGNRIYNGEQLGQSNYVEEARKYIPKDWKRILPNDPADYPEDITISDDIDSYEISGKLYSGFYERYVKIDTNQSDE